MPVIDPPFNFPFQQMTTYPHVDAAPPSVPFRSCCVCGGSPCKCPKIHDLNLNFNYAPMIDFAAIAENQLKWDKRYLSLAEFVAQWSKDPSTKTGAVICDPSKRIISLGYNGFPIGVDDSPERLNNREVKYQMIVHCERNAIIFARQNLEGCTLYTWPFASCSACAGMVIQTGIKRVVYPKLTDPGLIERWGKSLELTYQMFDEAGLERVEIEVEKK